MCKIKLISDLINSTMGILYVVATPIGNLEDITIRAIKVLLAAPVILCEDTRHTGFLMLNLKEKYSQNITNSIVKPRYVSIRDWNENDQVTRVMEMLNQGDIVILSDAGTPLLSDPGFKIVRAAWENGHQVVPIPGPFAGSAALCAAGLPTNKFTFLGFWFDKYQIEETTTTVFYESPERIIPTLEKLCIRYPNADVCLAMEMTKIHENFVRGKIADVLEKLKTSLIKGEITVLIYYKLN